MSPTQSTLQRASLKKDMAYIGILVFVVMTLMSLNFWYTAVSSRNDKNYIRITGELRILSQTISKHAASAMDGIPDALPLLQKSRDEFDLGIAKLKNGEPQLSLPASVKEIKTDELLNVENSWHIMKEKVDMILSRQELLASVPEVEALSTKIIPTMQAKFFNIMELYKNTENASVQVVLSAKQSILAERILQNMTKVVQGKGDIIVASQALKSDLALFSSQLDRMREGANPQIQSKLAEITPLANAMIQRARQVLDASLGFAMVQKASYDIYRESQNLLDRTTILSRAYMLDAEHRFIGEPTGYMLAATSLLLLVWLGYRIFADTKESLALTAEQNRLNREAVLKLLKELENLASGDLTTHTSIGSEITGAIAESINSAIDALRRLVFTINDTAVQVSNSAQAVQSTSLALAEASENQSNEIVGVNAAMNAMANSAEQVADHAIESSQVAQGSVVIAKSGVSTVQNTISGMERMREQIQETSVKIKRLGDSTQEIGKMVSLIDDITDQTNILALNASIQASIAGDAGKGFAVVAEEVQRLAERSSKATRQIEMLVHAIQSDTNDTMTSMEQATQEVVLGTTLAKDAGVALEEIENVSLKLAQLIQKISMASKEQVETAEKISQNMDVIQNITRQTTQSTHVTAGSIGTLAELAIELKDSVAGFKLPNEIKEKKA